MTDEETEKKVYDVCIELYRVLGKYPEMSVDVMMNVATRFFTMGVVSCTDNPEEAMSLMDLAFKNIRRQLMEYINRKPNDR